VNFHRGSRVSRAVGMVMFFLIVGFLHSGLAQSGTTPLTISNNYFVTGDYVVAGVGLRGLGVNGYATKQFSMPDSTSVGFGGLLGTGVPLGADIVGAFLYWETVESSQTTFAGQNGFFRAVFQGGPATGYPITGAVLGNPNAPVSWSSGGCSGNSQGSKTMRTYGADVRALLPLDAKGNVLANGTYEVSLADSGSNGGGAPLTLGASLVIIYRVLSPSVPFLTSVVIYDGAFAPSNGSSTVTQPLQGFYQAAASPMSKLTHIVGNGQNNKNETVLLNGKQLPSLYGSLPPFPGHYNGSWDNPTWSLSSISNPVNPVNANDASATTTVTPNASNSGCVSWGAVIFSTTVQNTDKDGLLDVWKAPPNSPNRPGYCDASINGGVCNPGDAAWVDLPGAQLGTVLKPHPDLFVEMDSMCSIVNADGTCDTVNGYSFAPSANAVTMMTNAFAKKGITAHFIPGNNGYPAPYGTGAILEQTCTDTTDASGNQVLCPFVNQAGIVGWKSGFEFLKNQPLNYPDENSCEQALNGPCIRRFQHGRKDSYHYALFAHAVGLPEWSLQGGSLSSVVATGNIVTFTTSSPNGLIAGTDRVTISDASTNPSLNGTYSVQTASGNIFTILIPTATNATYTQSTDPGLSVASGRIYTTSGVSDIGGADSTISLGLWGAAGQTDQVEAGTFMHELGHSNGLTHGGFYYDTPGNYVATLEPNCKPNYQSIMNYQFQVDLLDNGLLDYSEQQLSTLNENTLPAGLTTTNGSALAYSTTKWYTPVQPNGIGSAATHHCDGTPLSPDTDPNRTMYLLGGNASPITPPWASNSDANFDGTISTSLRGYNDWANLDLRQLGATGSDIFGTGRLTGGTGRLTGGAGRLTGGTGRLTGGAGRLTGGAGVGNAELSFETANSSVRPPRSLTAVLTPAPRYIQLNWNAPTFGQISSYNIYRATNGTPVPPAIVNVPGNTLTYTDKNVTCGPTYTYVVTALLSDGRESVPSNSVSQTDCLPPYVFTGFYSPLATADPPNTNSYSGPFNLSKSVTAKWTLQDSAGNLVTNLNANILYGIGPFAAQADGTCRPSQVSKVAGCSVTNPPSCPANVQALYSPTAGAKGNSTFRFSSNQFVFNWDTKTTTAGCYVLELDLDSGQVERTGLKLQ
jgi:hypothetical protein